MHVVGRRSGQQEDSGQKDVDLIEVCVFPHNSIISRYRGVGIQRPWKRYGEYPVTRS